LIESTKENGTLNPTMCVSPLDSVTLQLHNHTQCA
jgi:hypothetical protein